MIWETETIPPDDLLFMRVHKNLIKENEPIPLAFKVHGENEQKGASTDWQKYSTSQQTRSRLTRKDAPAKPPENYGVVEFSVNKVASQGLLTAHAPIQEHPELFDNRAHTNIKGTEPDMDNEVRVKLLDAYRWAVLLSDPL